MSLRRRKSEKRTKIETLSKEVRENGKKYEEKKE